jgi:hypothetical protein
LEEQGSPSLGYELRPTVTGSSSLLSPQRRQPPFGGVWGESERLPDGQLYSPCGPRERGYAKPANWLS